MATHETPLTGTVETIEHDRTRTATAWWMPARTKIVGLATLLWGVAFAALVFTYNALDLGLMFESGSFQNLTIWISHSIAYVLMAAVLLAVDARYGDEYGRISRALIFLECVLLGALAVFGLWTEFTTWEPAFAVTGLSFVGTHVLATIVGIVLWRTEGVSRLAAGLFIAVVPVIGVTAALALVGVPVKPGLFEAPLTFGFVALSYGLWSGAETTEETVAPTGTVN